jgi:multidrug efflux pump subunit AcrA (membrane-fusion protein)
MQSFLNRLAFPGWRYTLAALIVLAIGGYVFMIRGADEGTTLVVSSGDFSQRVSVSGIVVAARDVELGFAANGRILGTYANVGRHVFAGTILAETENGDLVAALMQKQAVLASLLAGTRSEQLAVVAATVANNQAKLMDAITAAYTVSDDAVHNKIDVFFTNPRTQPELSFTVTNATLETLVEHSRISIEPELVNWARIVAKLTSDTAAESAIQAQLYLTQVAAFLADANTALNQSVPNQTVSAATLASYATTLATARTNVNTAATELTKAISALTDAQKTLALEQAGPTTSDIAATEADVRSAQATLAKTRVVAPFSGIVTRMDAKVGEIVSPSVSLISIQSDGIFQIETYVPEVSIARIAVGNRATTTLDAYGPSIAFPATVVAVDPAETMKDGVPAYKTMLAFLATDPRIRSGMTANVIIETGILHDAIVIPAGAVGMKNNMPYVSVVAEGTVQSRTVTTGPSPALGQAQILSGLSVGDVILLSPAP